MKRKKLLVLGLKLVYLRLRRILGLDYLDYIYYVSSSEALPPPLSPEEEGYLLEKLKKGDGAVRTILIERN
ncbi:MAG TPA: RNA polymerase sporulation sigma factor SigE, partial [Bacillota bacterium]|nr:RNA polymerase sporulation sigma factor SigE [Bacillota bacterium]